MAIIKYLVLGILSVFKISKIYEKIFDAIFILATLIAWLLLALEVLAM